MPDTHTFDNGIRVLAEHLIQPQIERYAKGPNLHEPIEEEWVVKLIGTLGGGPGVFVDVGAAIGYYCFFVHRLNPKVELHAYEPDPANRDRIGQNLPLNGTPTVQVHPEGVAAKAGGGTLVGEGFTGCVVGGKAPGGRAVATTTIDQIAAGLGGPIDLLKMDIQGGEADALIGAEQVLRSRAVKNWIVGTHSPQLHAYCVDTFRKFSHRVLFESMRVDYQPDGLVVAATGRR
jgi:FkbM family methyltransferase